MHNKKNRIDKETNMTHMNTVLTVYKTFVSSNNLFVFNLPAYLF